MTTRSQFPAFTVLCAVSILFWWHPLVTTLRLARTSGAYTHIILILPLSAALIYTDWKYVNPRGSNSPALRVDTLPSPRLGAFLLAFALLTGGYARWGMSTAPDDFRLALDMFALVTWWIASILLSFGATTVYSLLFPMGFLFLMVPIPAFALDRIVELLQYQSATAARIMFRLVGIPATQDGIMLSIPGLDIEVARECSSIRSSLMLVVTTMTLAHLFLRSWRNKVVLIASVIPLSVVKNGLRIVTIGALGTRLDPGFLDGKLHHEGGIIFFGIAVAAVVILVWILRRIEFRTESKHAGPHC
jgi:exosortase